MKPFGNFMRKQRKELITESKAQPKSQDIINVLIMNADAAMDNNDFARAADAYKNILKCEQNDTAMYNLGSLYAQGKGVEQNFMEAAYLFHQVEINGDEQAGKLCLKCSMDFIHQNFDSKSPEQLYYDMEKFIKYVKSEISNVNQETCRSLYCMAENHFNKTEYPAAAKLYRAAAEYGNDGYSQNYLAVLYNAGAGVKKNDLAALYWFDKAVDNGAANLAQKDRDGILNAYRASLSSEDFYRIMMTLSDRCATGSVEVPQDAEKAKYWKTIGRNMVIVRNEK